MLQQTPLESQEPPRTSASVTGPLYNIKEGGLDKASIHVDQFVLREGSKLLTPGAFEFVLDSELKRAVRSQNSSRWWWSSTPR